MTITREKSSYPFHSHSLLTGINIPRTYTVGNKIEANAAGWRLELLDKCYMYAQYDKERGE